MKRLLILFILILSVKCFAQKKRANTWYFGKFAGLNFSGGNPTVLLNSAMNVLEGSACMCDTSGNLLFYSNGITVWNSMHVIMPNGAGLLGGSSTAQTLIVPKPKSNTSFYIFYADHYGGPNGLRYSEVDMQLNNGLGDVVSNTKNTLLHINASEKIAAVNHCDGINVWVITVNYATDQFYAYLVTQTGIQAPVQSGCMPDVAGCCNSIKFSPDGKWLAYTNNLSSQGDDSQLYRFNNQTGVATFHSTLPRNVSTSESLWGLSFSPANSKLYITSAYNTDPLGMYTRLYQYDLNASNIANSKVEILRQTFVGSAVAKYPFGQLQNAPNGKMYFARWGSWTDLDTLGVINSPDLPGLSCNAVMSGVPLSGRSSLIGLPNYNESYFNLSPVNYTPVPISLALTGNFSLCAGNTTTIHVHGAGTYSWSTGSPDSSLVVSPLSTTHYTVNGYNGCGYGSAAVTITVIPLPVLTANSTSLCAGSSTVLIAHVTPPNGVTYLWQPGGATTRTLSISTSQTTNYTVTASFAPCNYQQSQVLTVTIKPVIQPTVDFYYVPACANDPDLQPVLGQNFSSGGSFTSATLPVNITTGWITPAANMSGTNSVTYVIPSTECSPAATSTALVDIDIAPHLTQSSDIKIAPGGSATLSVSSALSYTWNTAASMSCHDCPDPLVSPGETTRYCVVAENKRCKSQACINVIVTCEIGDFSFPNAFTPNGDGENDAFCLRGWDFCVTRFSILIFDRWGEKVYESKNPDFCWDGVFKGQILNADVFTYVVNASYSSNTTITKKGNITLIR